MVHSRNAARRNSAASASAIARVPGAGARMNWSTGGHGGTGGPGGDAGGAPIAAGGPDRVEELVEAGRRAADDRNLPQPPDEQSYRLLLAAGRAASKRSSSTKSSRSRARAASSSSSVRHGSPGTGIRSVGQSS